MGVGRNIIVTSTFLSYVRCFFLFKLSLRSARCGSHDGRVSVGRCCLALVSVSCVDSDIVCAARRRGCVPCDSSPVRSSCARRFSIEADAFCWRRRDVSTLAWLLGRLAVVDLRCGVFFPVKYFLLCEDMLLSVNTSRCSLLRPVRNESEFIIFTPPRKFRNSFRDGLKRSNDRPTDRPTDKPTGIH